MNEVTIIHGYHENREVLNTRQDHPRTEGLQERTIQSLNEENSMELQQANKGSTARKIEQSWKNSPSCNDRNGKKRLLSDSTQTEETEDMTCTSTSFDEITTPIVEPVQHQRKNRITRSMSRTRTDFQGLFQHDSLSPPGQSFPAPSDLEQSRMDSIGNEMICTEEIGETETTATGGLDVGKSTAPSPSLGNTPLSMHSIDEVSSFESRTDDVSDVTPRMFRSAMILSRLDESAYQDAASRDAEKLSRAYVFPESYPWHKPRAPLQRNTPRDIDDMYGIDYAAHDRFNLMCENGPFDYGRYETGQKRRRLPKENSVRAATRRTQDPGVIELTIITPPIVESGKSDMTTRTSTEVRETSAGGIASSEVNGRSQVNLHKRRRDGAVSLGRRTRKVFLSVKVGGVSSRSTLSQPSIGVYSSLRNNATPESPRRSIPLVANGSLPTTTKELLNKFSSLESSASQDADNSAKESRARPQSSKSRQSFSKKSAAEKKASMGRSRLIWTCPVDGTEEQGRNSRVPLCSRLTRVIRDNSTCKPPREVRVGVKLCNRLLSEVALDLSPLPSAVVEDKKNRGKRSSRNKKVADPVTTRLLAPRDDAIEIATARGGSSFYAAPKRPSISHLFTVGGSQSQTPSSMEDLGAENGIMTNVLRVKQKAQFVKMKYGATKVFKYIPPVFETTILMDGSLGAVCAEVGSLSGANVHYYLNQTAKMGDQIICSVCWAGNDKMTGRREVAVCVGCGLVAHPECCCSPSVEIADGDENGSRSEHETEDLEKSTQSGVSSSSGITSNTKWKCHVCQLACISSAGSQPALEKPIARTKPRRAARLPSRFSDAQLLAQPQQTMRIPTKASPRNRCICCPHRGGAMSPVTAFHERESKVIGWIHDACRIWSDIMRHHCANQFDSDNSTEDGDEEEAIKNEIKEQCSICGLKGEIRKDVLEEDAVTINSKLIRKGCSGLATCLARGCTIQFHPICALVVSKLACIENRHSGDSSEHSKDGEESRAGCKGNVADTPNAYSLRYINMPSPSGGFANLSSVQIDSSIPAAFCPLHHLCQLSKPEQSAKDTSGQHVTV